MNFILVNFGTSEHGLWNMKRFNFSTVLEATEVGNKIRQNEDGTGFVVIASYYEPGTNDDEMKVVYEENTENVDIQTFPYISVRKK